MESFGFYCNLDAYPAVAHNATAALQLDKQKAETLNAQTQNHIDR